MSATTIKIRNAGTTDDLIEFEYKARARIANPIGKVNDDIYNKELKRPHFCEFTRESNNTSKDNTIGKNATMQPTRIGIEFIVLFVKEISGALQ